jgi:hypothetical protein
LAGALNFNTCLIAAKVTIMIMTWIPFCMILNADEVNPIQLLRRARLKVSRIEMLRYQEMRAFLSQSLDRQVPGRKPVSCMPIEQQNIGAFSIPFLDRKPPFADGAGQN